MNAEAIRFWIELFLAAAAAAAIVLKVMSWSNKRIENRIIGVVRESTKQIQPDANGGKSLTDVALKVAEIRENQQVIAERVKTIHTELTTRMDTADKIRERIMRQTKADRDAWAEAMKEQGIHVPHSNPIDYETRKS